MSVHQPLDHPHAPPVELPDAAAEQARQAVHVGLWVSATRCLLTYVVAPAIGVLGVALGPLGLVLQVLGAVTASAGARRLWSLGHWLRVPYVAVALVVDAVTLVALAELAGVGPR
jgi:hypothetical protein